MMTMTPAKYGVSTAESSAADIHHNPISPFHDIPLYADKVNKICNMVVEIPRWTNHKMEISKEEEMNPIKQDIKKGAVRFVKNCFPHHGYIWNYGALPQTWEDGSRKDPTTGQMGDNDPVHPRGSIIQVNILGVMGLIEEGKTDWKVICIDVTDPLAEQLNDIDDVEKVMPGFLKEFALKVIDETNQQWQNLINGVVNRGDISCFNVYVAGSPYQVTANEAKAIMENSAPPGPAVANPDDVDKWHYINT